MPTTATVKQDDVTQEDSELLRHIADLGLASEVELQARTLRSLKPLREVLDRLEKDGYVRRKGGFFKGGFGDGIELTQDGYKSVR